MLQRLKELLEKLKWAHVVLLVGGGAAFFYLTLDNSDIISKEEGLQAEQQSISKLESKIEEAKQFEKQFEEKKKHYAELVKSLQNLKEALPRQFFLPDLLSELLREAKQLEVEITSIRPDQTEKSEELYNSLGFFIEAKGTFLQFFILLDRMANMQRLVHVESFKLSRDGARLAVALGGDEGAFAGTKLSGGRSVYPGLSLSLRVVTYRYRGSATATQSPGSPPAPGGK